MFPRVASFLNVDQIPEYCANLAHTLSNQPYIQVNSGARVKALVLDSDEARIVGIFNRNSKHSNAAVSYFAYNYGIVDAERRPVSGVFLNEGVQMRNFSELKGAYESILKEMRTGWYKTNPNDAELTPVLCEHASQYLFYVQYPNIEDSRAVFLEYEMELIRSIANKLGITGADFNCSDVWQTRGCDLQKGAPYLWIHRNAKGNIARQFGFHFYES